MNTKPIPPPPDDPTDETAADEDRKYKLKAKLTVRLYADDVLVAETNCPVTWNRILDQLIRDAKIKAHADQILGVLGVVIGGHIVPCPECSELKLVARHGSDGWVKCAACGWEGTLADLEPKGAG